jgi:acetyltransferase-like isoleucine patch superfamily enzyme
MRTVIKVLASAVAWIVAAPLAYIVRWVGHWDSGDELFRGGSQAASLLPGPLGVLVRRHYYGIVLATPAQGLTVEFGTIFSCRGTSIGRNVYIGAYCTIGLCHLHDDVLIGSCVDIVSGKRVHFFDRTDVPIRQQGGERRKLDIGPDVWVGNKAVVMASVGGGTVVGAGSVVTADCEAMAVYVGNPARRVKGREAGSPAMTS